MSVKGCSPQIPLYSEYYRTFSNVVTIRTVRGEHLIAMKLRAWRTYKKDQSDVVGILLEHYNMGDPITLERVKQAVIDLYDDWAVISEVARKEIENSIYRGNFEQQYKEIRAEEIENNGMLKSFLDKYPESLTEESLPNVLAQLKAKKEKPSVLKKLEHNKEIVRERESHKKDNHKKNNLEL